MVPVAERAIENLIALGAKDRIQARQS